MKHQLEELIYIKPKPKLFGLGETKGKEIIELLKKFDKTETTDL